MRNEEIHINLVNPLFSCEPLLCEMFSFSYLILSSPMVLGVVKAKEEIM